MTNAEIQLKTHKAEMDAKAAERAETRRSNLAKERIARTKNILTATKQATDVGAMLGKAAALANDPKFYTSGQESLIKGIVPTNFGNPLGVSELVPNRVQFSSTIMAFPYIPTFGGITDSRLEPVNKAASMIFTAIQRATNYSKSYQEADVMLMLLAYREIISLSHFIAKLMSVSLRTSMLNPAIPAGIFQACGVDYDNYLANAADYRKRFTLMLVNTKQLFIPNIPLFDRAAQIAGGIYADDPDSEKTTCYTFYPYCSGFYELKDGVGTISQIIHPHKTSEVTGNVIGFSMQYYLDILEHQIKSILSYTNFKFISGDLARISNNFWDPATVDIDSPRYPIYDLYTLAQIQNATVIPVDVNLNEDDHLSEYLAACSALSITQDGAGAGTLIASPRLWCYKADASIVTHNNADGLIVNLPSDEIAPTTDMVIDATRLKNYGLVDVSGEGEFSHYNVFSADGYVVGTPTCGIITYDPSEGESRVIARVVPVYGDYLKAAHSLEDLALMATSNLATFEFAPTQYYVYLNGNAEKFVIGSKLENVRVFDSEVFRSMNEAALYSLLGISQMYGF